MGSLSHAFKLTLTQLSDAAVTMGMVLLCEAATSELDIGKRKSMLHKHQLLVFVWTFVYDPGPSFINIA